MRTIKPITDAEIAGLRAEPQSGIRVYVAGHAGQLLPRRIMNRIIFQPSTGCWRIGGHNTGNGFANITLKGKTRKVHRVIYTLLVSPIPDGHVLDHKKDAGCQWRDCGNPDHLEPVSVAVNTHRGAAILMPKKEARYA